MIERLRFQCNSDWYGRQCDQTPGIPHGETV